MTTNGENDWSLLCRECGRIGEHADHCPYRKRKIFYTGFNFHSRQVFIEGDQETADLFRMFLQGLKHGEES